MSVEGSANIEQQPAEIVAPAPTVTEDSELEAVWNKLERDNGAGRDETGRFASSQQGGEEEPLEGGEGGEAGDEPVSSTPGTDDVPLPSNWRGLEATWAKIPPEIRGEIKAHEDKLHQTLSQQGQALSTLKPVSDVINSYAEYFGGERGNYKPHEAVDYLFNLQRQMDDKPLDTLLQIADTYDLRPHLQRMFANGGDPQQGGNEAALMSKISQLESTIQRMADPSTIDRRITEKLQEDRTFTAAEQIYSRVSKEMPLISEIEENDLTFFINKAWTKLGSAASQEAVLRAAGEMAINADPDLRARDAARKSAATQDPERVAAAKRANQTNIRSTSTGQGRPLTDDEELGKVWDKSHRS